jgi:hypothetical protein
MTKKAWALGTFPFLARPEGAPDAGVRVVIDNDFAGDPDDLFQVAHHVMSPGVEVRGIIASHLRPGDAFGPGDDSAEAAERRLRELFDVMGLDAGDVIRRGAKHGLVDASTPQDSPGARVLIAEAMRDDPRPLYVCCGGGLTEVASAWLIEPRIAERLTVVWIGGPEHAGLTSPWPPIANPEYNLAIDLTAGQVVFGSDLPLWVVPRNAYRQCLVSAVELQQRVAGSGALGAFLHEALLTVARDAWARGAGVAETYALGDQPLVLLTALQSFYDRDTSSSAFALVPAPELDDAGGLVGRPDGRPIRVYTHVDTRLMFEDMFGKFEVFAHWQGE